MESFEDKFLKMKVSRRIKALENITNYVNTYFPKTNLKRVEELRNSFIAKIEFMNFNIHSVKVNYERR